MFTKSDVEFDVIASDPSRRRLEISLLTKRRGTLYWAAMLATLAAVGSMFVGRGGYHVVTFNAAMLWIFVLKINSDLRLLRVIDRFHSDKPVHAT